MTTPMPSPVATWFAERRSAITAIAVGAVTWPIAFAAAWLWWPTAAVPSDRIAYALELCAAPALVLLLMISACMRLFDTAKAENPLLAAESARWKINQRVVTNTVEQLAMFVPIVIALATRLPRSQLKLLPIAVTLWCAGRLMFWIGYHIAPRWRGPGFDWTFLTTWLLAGWFVSTLV